MFLTNEQVQELQDTGIDEKIEKFAELFPNGTEVTYDLCIKHPDVFSFGLPGARLLPPGGWKAYWDKVFKAKRNYKIRKAIAGCTPEERFRDFEKEKIAYERRFAKWEKENIGYYDKPRIFSCIPILPPPPLSPDEYKITEERITRDYNLELALIFYDATMEDQFHHPLYKPS